MCKLIVVEQENTELEDLEIQIQINKKIKEIDGSSEEQLSKLKRILLENKKLFREGPGCIVCYEHEFEVKDNTPTFYYSLDAV